MVLPCSQSDAVMVGAAQGAGLFIGSCAVWSFRLVMFSCAESPAESGVDLTSSLTSGLPGVFCAQAGLGVGAVKLGLARAVGFAGS